MINVAHISDLHFGRDIPERLACLISYLNDLKPDLTVISGDLTQRATSLQYKQARAFLSRLKTPYLAVPGNHDISLHKLIERFQSPWKKWRRFIQTPLEPVVETSDFIAFGLNTVRPMGHRLNWTRGRLSSHQVSTVEQKLKSCANPLIRIIAAHHPFWLPLHLSGKRLIGRGKDAFERFKLSGVDLILGGHSHSPYIHLNDGVIICHAGSSFSNRLNPLQKNSFNLISGNVHRLKIERLEWHTHNFIPVETKTFKKKASVWEAH